MARKHRDDEPEEPELLAEPLALPEHKALTDPGAPSPLGFSLGVVQHTQFTRQLVVDLDFGAKNPIDIIHSFGSTLLYVSVIGIGNAGVTSGEPYPTFAFVSNDKMTVTAIPGAIGVYRIFVSVIPQ